MAARLRMLAMLALGIGLMLAPKSGADLRNDIRDRLSGGPDQLAGKFPAAVGTTPGAQSSKSY